MAARPSLDFVLKLAWRETRGAGRHFAYLIACITLGVGALVAVGSFASSLERTAGRAWGAPGGPAAAGRCRPRVKSAWRRWHGAVARAFRCRRWSPCRRRAGGARS